MFEKAEATSGQAEARAYRPSQARKALIATHLKNIPELACHIPVFFAQLVLPEFHFTITSDGVNCRDMLNCEVKHVECRIPLGLDITGHHLLGKLELLKDGEPLW